MFAYNCCVEETWSNTMIIIYKATGLRLGELHKEQEGYMYRLWDNYSDEDLDRLGLERRWF